MHTLQLIQKTAFLWGLSSNLPELLRSTSEISQTEQGSPRIASSEHIKVQKFTEPRGDSPNYQITETSFFERGFE